MRAGKLQASIMLLRPVKTKAVKGAETVEYVPVPPRIAANAKPVRGRQFEALQQAQSELQIIFAIYYRADVQPDWRVEHRGIEYEIIGVPVDVDARKQWLELHCMTSQNA